MSVQGILVGQGSGGPSIELATSIDKNSTYDTIPSTRAFYDFLNPLYGFVWSDDDGLATKQWFAALSAYLKSGNAPDASWVGRTKSVTLTSPVLGTTTHLIRCIGVNQDGANTVTFQTKNCLNEYTKYSSLSWSSTNYDKGASWTDTNCLARLRCEDYYNAFPGKDYIKTVSKGWCADTDQSRGQTNVTYLDMNVFLLSEREFGLDSYSPITTANSTTTRAECTYGYNAPYSFYTSNKSRIMRLGDEGTDYGRPWERSRYSGSSSGYRGCVCLVLSDGYANYDFYTNENGLAPAFVIG